jgi:hypothetical protein
MIMSETDDRTQRQALRKARQAKRTAKAQKAETSPAERKQARMKRRAERAHEAAARARPAAAKPGHGPGRNEGPQRKNRTEGMQRYLDTKRIALGNAGRREYPDRLHDTCRGGALFPDVRPKFKLDLGPNASLFTIGAGFSRDVEPALAARGVSLPTTAITIPQADYGRPENPLNEYTAGTIAQRLNAVFQDKPIPKATLVQVGQLVSDQLLPGAFNGPAEMIESLRREIAAIYAKLRDCGALIITLSSVESFYDAKSRRFFNRTPPRTMVRSREAHIFFEVQDVRGVVAALSKPLKSLGAAGIKVVLVVSPAAQPVTFSMADAVTANELAKSTLRVAAEQLIRKFDHVDYFPALEIARSAGLHAYMDDNVHLRDEVSALLVETFIKTYAA